MLRWIINLDTGIKLLFDARTVLEAMNQFVYYRKLTNDDKLRIDKSISGEHLYIEANDGTWCIRND